jgi:cell division protease FtsH
MNNNSPNPNKMPDSPWKRIVKNGLVWVMLIFIAIYITKIFNPVKSREIEISYPEYQRLLQSGAVEKAKIMDREFHAELKYEEVWTRNNREERSKRVKTTLPFDVDREMVKEWDKAGLRYEIRERTTDWWSILLYPMLPMILFVAYLLFIWRRTQGGAPKGIFSFGKSRAKLLTENRPKITFKDVAGADEAKQELQEVIEFLKEPEKFQTLGGRIPKGVLLLGPPGTGKTLLAKAVAGEAGVPFFSISGAEFVEMFVGVGASRVRDLFEQGKRSAPCIIFIDEIDAVGRHRGAGLGGGHDEREQTLNQLLVEMDGFDTNEGVILIAATNRPDVLDSALLRPGRFDRQVVVDRPDFRGREGILKVHTRKIPLAESVDLMVLAKGSPGFSGADLANMVNEAALLAARRNKKQVEMVDFEEAKDKVLMGVERKSLFISEDEKKATAYHESGHVLVSKLIPGSDPIHKVTIIPRGRALGITSFLPIDEKHTYTKSYCETRIAHLVGGRIGEKLITHELSTGAGDDIERATDLARKMVCEWGMSDRIGPVTFGKKSEEIFLGREIAQHRDYSEKTAILIDQEVKRIVHEVYERAEKLIKDNEDKLHLLATALLDRENLDGDEIDRLLKGKSLPTVKRKTPSTAKKENSPKKKEVTHTE